MRYLKQFNEKNNLYNSIKYDTNNYLSYLIDNGYSITFSDEMRYHMVYISTKKKNDFINWLDIKDEVVPYLQMMSKNYYLEIIESRDTIIGNSLLKTYYFELDLDSLIREKNIKFSSLSLSFKKRAKKVNEGNDIKCCADCGVEWPEYYFYKDWFSVVPKSKHRSELCLGCLNKRKIKVLGSPLNKEDFSPYYDTTSKFMHKISESLDDNTLYVFDFDDTLVATPRFEDLVIEYLKENVSIGDIIQSCVSDIGVNISDLKWENGRIFIDDVDSNIDIPNGINWIRKGKRIYLVSPDNFGLTKISMPTAPLDMIEFYNSVENKCIVTARSEKVRDDVESILNRYNMEYPKYDVHMYPFNKHYQTGYWKGKTIVEICKKNNFNSAIFYDDNAKYIKGAKRAVKELGPNLKFKAVKV